MAEVMKVLTALIRRFEGLRLRAYYCPAGVLTCGYGSTGPDITPSTVWTPEQAEERMMRDAEIFLAAAQKLCPALLPASMLSTPSTQSTLLSGAPRQASADRSGAPRQASADGRLAAIADFTYNLGATRLAGSTLRRKINRGDMRGAAMEFSKWVYAGGRKLPGLVARREYERMIFTGEAA